MAEARTVSLAVELPIEMASEAEALQLGNPEMLSWIVAYGLTRRAIFEHFSRRFEREVCTRAPHDSILSRP